MKHFKLLALVFLTVGICSFTMMDGKMFPNVTVKTLQGKSVNLYEKFAEKEVTVVSFWASWCAPCKRELDAIADLYPDWIEEYDVQLLAITTDNARSLSKVKGIQAKKQWEYQILSDSNQRLQAALNFQTIPQTYIVDKAGNILDIHSGYNPGDEIELEEKIKKFSSK